jgi:hypothetical protein
MKQVAVRPVHLREIRIYTGNRRELPENSPVPTGSLRGESEPIRDISGD